jgi:hypothetical protein
MCLENGRHEITLWLDRRGNGGNGWGQDFRERKMSKVQVLLQILQIIRQAEISESVGTTALEQYTPPTLNLLTINTDSPNNEEVMHQEQWAMEVNREPGLTEMDPKVMSTLDIDQMMWNNSFGGYERNLSQNEKGKVHQTTQSRVMGQRMNEGRERTTRRREFTSPSCHGT